MGPAVTQAMAIWAPPPRLTVSEWADRERRLSPEASAEPGRWITARAEYQRGIMDAVSDPSVETVVVIKSAQVGWTEILNNVVGYHIAQDPAPILVVQPTVEMGTAWSKDRLAPMLRDTPQLKGLVADVRSRDGDNTLLHKTFPGGHVTIAGANSAASLASRPIRMVLFDEVDRYPPSAGSEGDPVTLGRKRTATYWNRKILIGSSPTIEGVSRIEHAYLGSDQRRYHVPCPDCGEMQALTWTQVRWEGDDAQSARYHCSGCGVAWTDAQRWGAVRRGEWRAMAEFRGIAGFHISELYSPWRRLADTVADFMAAKDRPEMLKAWVNTALGETWRDKGQAPDADRLMDRREPWPMGRVPVDVLALTIGADLQNDRIEAYLWGWGRGLERWLIDAEVFHGRPADAAPWDALAAWAQKDWRREDGGTMRALKCAVDTGGQDTAAAYGHIRRLGLPALMVAVKGVDRWGASTPVQGPTAVDALLNGQKIKRGLKLWTVAVSTFKSELYRSLWLQRSEDGSTPPGWVHLPEGLTAEQVRQLVAEQLQTVKDKRGFARQEWAKIRDRNEALDCAVYARAALWVAGADRRGEGFWQDCADMLDRAPRPAPQQEAVAPAAVVQQAPMPPPAVRQGGWLRRPGGWLR